MIEVGIIGSGSMGRGIAQVAATAGHTVHVYDNNPTALDNARAFLEKILARQVEKERMTTEQKNNILGRIQYHTSMLGCARSKLIIEAVVEDLGVKKTLFEQLEDSVSQDCILASNTSSLPIAAIAAACKKPERVLGIHFFNPAPLMKLVEIIPAVQTTDNYLEQAIELIASWGKLTVTAKDTPGFIVNRVARPFYGESLRILEEGIADIATIDWALKAVGGFKMGPFTLMDYIGHDINYKVTETVFKAFYYDPRYKPSFAQKRLMEAGFLGKKTGRGFYNYQEGASNPAPVKDEKLGQQILDRVLAMLINEAADALHLGVASKEDIDLAMTKGVNYPKGLLRWADEIGLSKCVMQMDGLHDWYLEDRYRCSPILRKKANEGTPFFSE